MTLAHRTDLALLAARVPLGLYFAIAGYNKLAGGGLKAFVDSSIGNVPAWAAPLGRPYLYALPFVEIVAGLLVAVGLLVRLNATLMVLMLLSFLIAQGSGPNIARVVGSGGVPFDRNVLLLSIALLLMLLGGGRLGLEGAFKRRKVTVQPV